MNLFEDKFLWWDRLDGTTLTTLGTLSKDDDNSSENVSKKMNLSSFKLNLVYLDPLNTSNADNFSWS